MLTVVATLKQQQRNVFAYLTAACEGVRLFWDDGQVM